MATMVDVIEGIRDRLLTIDGLRVQEYVPGQVTPPQAIIGVPPVPDYNPALAGRMRATLAPTVTVLTSSAIDRIGQKALAELADWDGDRSVAKAFAADRTLGGIVSDCQVVSFEPLGLEEVGVIGYYGGRFTLRLLL
jgi:hypothetical protein